MYRWLESIGLHQRKSLTLAGVDVPEEHFLPLVRGLLDGDGTVYTLVHAPTPSTYPNYRYERLWVYFTSASVAHIQWLRARLSASLEIHGYMQRTEAKRGRHEFFKLKYGKHESIRLLSKLYEDEAAPRLERKWAKWMAYRRRNCAEGGI